jgi:hypothetical protein
MSPATAAKLIGLYVAAMVVVGGLVLLLES